jgi:hypothetical protein
MHCEPLTEQKIQKLMAALPELFGHARDASRPPLTSEPAALMQLLNDYYRLMEIAHYIRRGGIKAMVYRLQTGRLDFQPVDYFDEANDRLAEHFACILPKPQPANMLEHLQGISDEEEEAVKACLKDLDTFLIAAHRGEPAIFDEKV